MPETTFADDHDLNYWLNMHRITQDPELYNRLEEMRKAYPDRGPDDRLLTRKGIGDAGNLKDVPVYFLEAVMAEVQELLNET